MLIVFARPDFGRPYLAARAPKPGRREDAFMKKDIHPTVYKATITCACGNQEEVLSTKGEQVHVEVCSACHPFFTGKQRFLDTAGRIDRFRKKYAKFEKK